MKGNIPERPIILQVGIESWLNRQLKIDFLHGASRRLKIRRLIAEQLSGVEQLSRGEFECRVNHEHGWLNADDSRVESFLCSHQGDGIRESVEIQHVLQKVVVPLSEETRRRTRSFACAEERVSDSLG
jgi:hypothetical protein